jgi:hypothetical protein
MDVMDSMDAMDAMDYGRVDEGMGDGDGGDEGWWIRDEGRGMGE